MADSTSPATWQWVADWFDPVHSRRIVRGGGDLTTPAKIAISYVDAAPPAVRSVVVGFRCARLAH